MTRRINLVPWTMAGAAAIVGAMVGLLAVIDPLLAIGCALAFAFVGLVMADLRVGVGLFTFVAFLEVLPNVGGLSAAKLTGLVLLLSWVMSVAASPGAREQFAGVHPGALYVGVVFLAWVAASALWAENSGDAFVSFERFAPNVALLPIVYSAVRNRRDVRWILGVFVVGALLSTFYGAFIAPGDADAAAEGRLTGAGVDPNYLAASLVAALVLSATAVVTRENARGIRLGGAAVAVMLMIALVSTASRTGVAALIAACVAGVLFAGRGRRLSVTCLAVVALGVGALYIGGLAPQAVRDRLTEVGTGTGRTDIWTVGWRMVQAHPVRGIGGGNFPVSSVHYLLQPGTIRRADFIVDTPKGAHNIYLETWAELGIVGLALLLSILGFCLGCGLRAAQAYARMRDHAMELLARAVVVATVGMLAAAFFNSLEYLKPIWLMLSIGPCLLAIARREAAAQTTAHGT